MDIEKRPPLPPDNEDSNSVSRACTLEVLKMKQTTVSILTAGQPCILHVAFFICMEIGRLVGTCAYVFPCSMIVHITAFTTCCLLHSVSSKEVLRKESDDRLNVLQHAQSCMHEPVWRSAVLPL